MIAYNVSQRTRELGIRMALGAGKTAVLRLVVGQSAMLTGLGVGLGLLGAFPLPNVLGSMFNGADCGHSADSGYCSGAGGVGSRSRPAMFLLGGRCAWTR